MSEFLGDYRLDPPSEDYPEPEPEDTERECAEPHDFAAGLHGDPQECRRCRWPSWDVIHQVSHPEDAVANQERPE